MEMMMEGTRYTTWAALIEAMQSGELEGMRLRLDSHAVTLEPPEDDSDTMSQERYDEISRWFRCHPEDALRLLLDHLGIPWEPA